MKNYIITGILLVLSFLELNAQNVPNLAWAKHFSGMDTDYGFVKLTNTIDNQGSIFSGITMIPQTYNVDGIQLSGMPSSLTNGYISKRDANRNIIWAVSTRMLFFDYANILVDSIGNSYFYAYFTENPGYIPYIGNIPLAQNAADNHAFLIKIDDAGNVVWFKDFNSSKSIVSGNSKNTSTLLSFDNIGNIQIVSPFVSDVSISTDTLFSSNNLGMNVFYAKFSPDGNLTHFQKLTGSEYDESKRITEKFGKDAFGNIYRFSARYGTPNKQIVYKYNIEGNLLDSIDIAISSAGQYQQLLTCFAIDPLGDVFIGGSFFSDLTLAGTVYTNYGGGAGNFDAVLFKLSMNNHQVEWVRTISLLDNDQFDALDVDDLGNVYALGSKWSGIVQMEFQKYTKDGDLLWELPVATSAPYNAITPLSVTQTQNGGNILVSGFFGGSVDFGMGYAFTTISGYDGFIAQYGICNTPNPTIDTPFSTQLCGSDSITLSATLDNPNTTYFWSTPYGKVEIDNSTTNATLTVGQVGKYALISQEDAECYGKSQEIWITNAPLPDTSVTVQNNILTATENSQGTTYQWIDCENNNTPISGATAQTFEPTANGAYAVIITTENGCSDTSSCHVINTLSIQNNPMLDKQITLYPNPTSNEVNIQTDLDVSEVYILDLQGKELQKTSSKDVNLSNLSSGIYLIKVKLTNNEVWTSKVIKN